METKEITKEEKEILNQLVGNSLMQKWEWGEFKEKYDWQAKRFKVIENNTASYAFQVLIKRLPFGFSLIYGPINLPNKEIFKIILEKIKEIAKKENAIFFQADISENISPEKKKQLKNLEFIKSFEEIQPKNTLILDLTQPEMGILKQMKPKGRYNIKVAQKREVEVKEIKNLNEFKDYYKIHEETTKRDNISSRSFEYLKNLFSMLKNNNLGTAFVAYYKNEPISGIIVSHVSKKATYMYGASSGKHRNVMAPYLLQWTAIKYAKNLGCTTYDLFGIAPNDNPKHHWAGITRFKKQFGGKQQDFLGSYDLIFKPLMYNLFKTAMKLRKLK